MPSRRLLAALALLVTVIVWGSGGVFVRSLALAIDPGNSIVICYVLVTAINLVGLVIFGTRIGQADWARLLVAAIAGMVGFNIFTNYGLALVPAGVAGIIVSVEPLVLAFGAYLVLREELSPYVLAGMGVAIAGSVLLFWNDIGGANYPATGVLLVFLSSVSWAVYTIACKPLLKIYDSYSVTAWTMVLAAPVIILTGTQDAWEAAQRLGPTEWAQVFYLVVPYGILGTVLWNYGAARLSGAATGSFLYLIPVIAVTSGAVILGETVTANIVIGGLVILAGVAVAEFAPEMAARRHS